MYVVVNRITVAEGKAEEFENAFAASMRDHLPDVPGLVRSTLLKPRNAGDPYMSTMEFHDASSFQDWVKSESFRAAHDIAVDTTTESTIEVYGLYEDVVNG
jgi:heme-degrading monooxygenase HmoA